MCQKSKKKTRVSHKTVMCSSVNVCVCVENAMQVLGHKGGKKSHGDIQPQLVPWGMVIMATEAFFRSAWDKQEGEG